jgi:NitT/TauT family transport system substrate-binding protein
MPRQQGVTAMAEVSSKTGRRSVRRPVTRRAALTFAGAGMALAGAGLGFSQPARAAIKFRVLTNFYAEPGHGGIYQAKVTGLYEKAGLDVEIKQGGPQINGMQLLTGGEADILMGSAIGAIAGVQNGAPVVVIAPTYQFDMQCIVTRPDVPSIAALRGKTILVSTLGRGSYWLWMKDKYGFTDDQVAPYTGNYQPFIQDPTMGLGGVATSEPYRIEQAGVKNRYFLLAKEGYPPYGYPLLTMRPTIQKDRDAIARFVRATLEGWKSFLADPAPGLAAIKAERSDVTDGFLQYSVKTIRELGGVDGVETKTAGLGTMNDTRWRELADFMLKAGLLKPATDWQAAYTTEFVKDLKIMP